MASTYESTYSGNGLSAGAAWGGGAGVCRALDLAEAGQTVTVLNHATPASNQTLEALWKVPCTNTTNFAVNDLATMDVAGENCTGRIAVIVTDDYCLMEAVTGTFGNLVATDTITTDPGGGNTTLDGTPTQPGLWISADIVANGTVAALITLQGRNNGDTADEQVYLDCNGNALYGIQVDGAVDYWNIRHFDIHDFATHGIHNTGTTSDQWLFEQITCRGNSSGSHTGTYGFSAFNNFQNGTMVDCIAKYCGSSGWEVFPNFGSMHRCISTENTTDGAAGSGTGTSFIQCQFTDNTVDGFTVSGDGVTLFNCIIDGNGGDGIEINATTRDNTWILWNRITNNTGYGINASAGVNNTQRSDYNVFYGNNASLFNNFTAGVNDHGDDTEIPTAANRDVTKDGYNDATNGDYSLAGDATLRREPQTVGDTTYYQTAGLPPKDTFIGGIVQRVVR
jgi:hypothetical protein